MTEVEAGRKAGSDWRLQAAGHVIVGFALGAAINLLFVVSLILGFGWALSLEEWGTDFGMKVLAGFNSPGPSVEDNERRYGAPPIVYLDIDDRSCIAFVADPVKCRSGSFGHSEILPAVGEALKMSGARLIVLDYIVTRTGAVPDLTVRSEDFRAAWVEGEGPLVVAAAPTRPAGGREAAWLDWSRGAASGPIDGRLRYAAAVTYPTSPADDSVLRHLHLMVPILVRKAEAHLPSMGFAAAVYAQEGQDPGQADCILYHDIEDRDVSSCGLASFEAGKLRLPTGSDQDFYAAAEAIGKRRAFFTLRPLAGPGGTVSEVGRDSFRGTWDHYSLADWKDGDGLRFDGGALEGRIVIVGSSAASAEDWHKSPLGYMTGPEIIANNIVAIRTAAFVAPASALARLWNAIVSVFLASLLIAPFWAWICHLLRRRTPRRMLGAGFVFVLGTIVTFGLMLWISVWDGDGAGGRGNAVDFLIPTISVMLEGFVEGARALISRFEKWVEKHLARLNVPWKGRKKAEPPA